MNDREVALLLGAAAITLIVLALLIGTRNGP